MKKYFKYKVYKYINRTWKQAPKEKHFLQFKKAKWFIIKKIWAKNRYIRPKRWNKPVTKSFKENIKIYNPKYKLKRRKNTFRNLLQTKRLLYAVFNKALKIKFWQQLQQKHNWKRLDYVSTFLIKPYFKVDVLLWSLDFFISTRAVKKAIINKNIFLNNNLLQNNCFLKKGDILSVKKVTNLKKNKEKFTSDKKILSFLEVDYYTNTILITKDFHSITNKDIYLIARNVFSVTRWRYKI